MRAFLCTKKRETSAFDAVVIFVFKNIKKEMIKIEKVDLSKYIIKDLKMKGFEGKELQIELKKIKEKLPFAIEKMVEEALSNEALTAEMDFDKFFDKIENEKD